MESNSDDVWVCPGSCKETCPEEAYLIVVLESECRIVLYELLVHVLVVGPYPLSKLIRLGRVSLRMATSGGRELTVPWLWYTPDSLVIYTDRDMLRTYAMLAAIGRYNACIKIHDAKQS